MQGHHNEKISLPHTQYCMLLEYMFIALQQTHSLVEEKMVNNWAEVCKLLPRDRKNFALNTVTIYVAIR